MKTLIYEMIDKKNKEHKEIENPELLDKGITLYVNYFEKQLRISKESFKIVIEHFNNKTYDEVIAMFENYENIEKLDKLEKQMENLYIAYLEERKTITKQQSDKLRNEYINIYKQCHGNIKTFVLSIEKMNLILDRITEPLF